MAADYSIHFSSFDGKVWFNAGSEGPLPNVAARALEEAVEWKKKPFMLTNQRFASVPAELKVSISRLINVDASDVILGNSASYGLHLLANGLPLREGDEVLLMQNDFPSNILPWLGLNKIKVRQIKAKDRVLTSSELRENISERSRVLCVSHVHTFSGRVLEIREFARICQEHGIILIVNLSHSVGTMPVDVADLGADAAVSVGYKWLCGPYGTGFCWMKKGLRESLNLNVNYWISRLSEVDLKKEDPLVFKDDRSSRKFDVFGTANFFNFVPWKAAVDYFLEIGLDKVREHNQDLIDLLVDKLDSKKYKLISESSRTARSNLVVLTHKDPSKNERAFRKLVQEKIFPTIWKGNLRICPHIYNSPEQVSGLCAILNRLE